jgi:iron complex outermembrane recepter protein
MATGRCRSGSFAQKLWLSGVSLGTLLAGASPALAQPESGAPGATDETAQMQAADQTQAPEQASDDELDIYVTATRRSERLQDVPISAQVVDQETLVTENMTSLVTVARQNPSIKVQGSGRSSDIYIRGTGSGNSQSFDQSVGTFIDDIYHGRSRFADTAFLDIDRVEILKGPQSLYFGNNAIAGAFNIVTARPGDAFEGWARALISPSGDEHGGQYALEGALSLPITDEIAVRLAGTMNGQRGHLRNVNTGQRAPNIDNAAFRAMLRYTPTADLDITLKGEIGEVVNHGGLVLRNTLCPPPPPFTAAGFCAANLADGAPTGLDNSAYTSNPGNLSTFRTHETALTINYDFGGATVTSVTGYYDYDYLLDLDNDGTARQLLNVEAPEDYRQFSQELRIASPADRTLSYVAGLYFQSDRLDIEQAISFFFLTPNLSVPPVFAPLRPLLPIGQLVNSRTDERVYSAFAALTWRPTERLRLTGGLRASIVRKDFDWRLQFGTAAQPYGGIVPFPQNLQATAGLIGIGTAGSVALDRSDEALMPSASIQYDFTPDIMGYVSYNRGFKAGGFSVAELSAIPANYPFEPEFVDAYEAGLKIRLPGSRLSLDVAAFRNDFQDLQVVIGGTNAAGAPVNFVRNAAASRAQGVEVELEWTPIDWFRLSAAGTYLHSRYLDYRNAGATYAQQLAAIQAGRNPNATFQDLSGRPTPYAPEWSGSVTGTLTLPIGPHRLIAEATGIFSSSYFTIFTIDPLSRQDGYARLDARLSFELGDGHLAFDIIGKNLTDTTIITFSGYQPNSRGSFFQDRQPFRNIAFQVRYRF